VNKSQLIEKISEGADISKAAAGRALDSFIGAVTEELQNAGATIQIAAAKIPAFKAGKALKDACND